MASAKYRHRLRFDKRAVINDGKGNKQGGFVEQFSVWGAIEPKFGSEVILANRLTGRQPVNIVTRYSPRVAGVRTDWRIRDQNGKVYNIRSIVNVEERNKEIEFLTETGGIDT